MKRIIIAASLISLAVSTALYFLIAHDNKKIAVVDAIKLYNEFKMKKDLEGHNSGRLQELGLSADSLKRLLQAKSADESTARSEVQELYTDFMRAQQLFEGNLNDINAEINEQVWIRLNPLIDDYGREKQLRLIIGANGMGTVLYNDDYYDHTDAIIEYVNKRYEKGN